MTMQVDSAWINANIATMTDGSASYGEIRDAAMLVKNGKIVWLGEMKDLPALDYDNIEINDCAACWITPGLIDCHSHVVFAGSRANEFELRLQGASYEEIAQQGGGIVSTVKATREASEQELYQFALPRVNAMIANGVTSLEIKSGYGLDTDNEAKMLRVARKIGQNLPITIKTTFLGAHALPTEYQNRSDDYIELVVNDMLPKLASENLIDAVDVFCEGIGFNRMQTERVFAAAKALNLPVKIHAEQLSNIGGTELAAKYGALSSDHIEFLDESGVKAMQLSGTVAVLLPGAFYFLRETQLPPIDLLRQYKVPMAVATDCNPGSSPISSLQLMLNMACTLFRLTPAEALAGVTCHAAKALGIQENVGEISVGKQADFALWQISQPAELCYQFGVNPLISSYAKGQLIAS